MTSRRNPVAEGHSVRGAAGSGPHRPKKDRYLYGQCECGGPLLEDGSCESCLLTEDGWRGEYDDLFRGRDNR